MFFLDRCINWFGGCRLRDNQGAANQKPNIVIVQELSCRSLVFGDLFAARATGLVSSSL